MIEARKAPVRFTSQERADIINALLTTVSFTVRFFPASRRVEELTQLAGKVADRLPVEPEPPK